MKTIKTDYFFCSSVQKEKDINGALQQEEWEAHEDPVVAALRETREEIDVEVELTDLVGIYTADKGDNATGISFVFRGKVASGQIMPRQGEIMAFRFYSSREIEELITENMLYKPEYNLRAIEDWLEGKSYPLETIRLLGS